MTPAAGSGKGSRVAPVAAPERQFLPPSRDAWRPRNGLGAREIGFFALIH